MQLPKQRKPKTPKRQRTSTASKAQVQVGERLRRSSSPEAEAQMRSPMGDVAAGMSAVDAHLMIPAATGEISEIRDWSLLITYRKSHMLLRMVT